MEEMNAAEIVERLAKEKAELELILTILELLDTCENLEEAKEKVKGAVKKQPKEKTTIQRWTVVFFCGII